MGKKIWQCKQMWVVLPTGWCLLAKKFVSIQHPAEHTPVVRSKGCWNTSNPRHHSLICPTVVKNHWWRSVWLRSPHSHTAHSCYEASMHLARTCHWSHGQVHTWGSHGWLLTWPSQCACRLLSWSTDKQDGYTTSDLILHHGCMGLAPHIL